MNNCKCFIDKTVEKNAATQLNYLIEEFKFKYGFISVAKEIEYENKLDEYCQIKFKNPTSEFLTFLSENDIQLISCFC